MDPLTSWLFVIVVLLLALGAGVSIRWAVHRALDGYLAWRQRRHLAAFIATMKREADEVDERRQMEALSRIGSASRYGRGR